MNSRWNENFIIFTMELVLTHSEGRIKIRAFGARRELIPGQIWSNLVKVAKSLRETQV